MTGQITPTVEQLVLEEKTTLLKGEAGAGKSSVAVKVMKDWSERSHMKDITCCLFLAAGSDEKIPLYKIIWDEYSEATRWSESDAKATFTHLQQLAYEDRLAVIIDGLDEFGVITKKEVANASRAALHPPLEVDIKTACAGILNKTIFPGAKVLATGRSTELLNIDILESKASMKKLVELTEGDREKLIELIEPEPQERVRIQQELGRVSTDSNHYFLRAPLMIRIIIDLIIVRKVNIQNVKNSSEMYLMVKMKNLDFNTNSNTNFTELDPPEDQDYLTDVLKLCQMQMQ